MIDIGSRVLLQLGKNVTIRFIEVHILRGTELQDSDEMMPPSKLTES